SDAGRGGQSYTDGLPGKDGAVTRISGVVLTIAIADCAAVVLVDRAHSAIGIAHIGWRGTLLQVSARLLEAMIETYGSQPRELYAFISPAIGPCCLKVRRGVAEQFSSLWGQEAYHHISTEHSNAPRLNLWSSNVALLQARGVAEIEVADLCTKCNSELFFSHRDQGGRAGRFVTQVFLAA
ncbi:MAG: polyphenol oxidase family protein, partial [Acidimicrobiia bacterium]